MEDRSTADQTSAAHRIFLGDDGLRAGWSVLLFLLLVALLSALVNGIMAHLTPRPAQAALTILTPRSSILRDGIGFAVMAAAAAIMAIVERRPFRRYGLSGPRAVKDFLIGLGWGITFLSLLVGALLLLGGMHFNGVILPGSAAVTYGLKWLLAFVCVGLLEEFFFRGYLQFTIARGVAGVARALNPEQTHTHAIAFWTAAGLLSMLLFALLHTGNGGETVLGILAVAAAGSVFAFSLWRTGTLWWAIGFHTAWDWAQTYLYGTPDSGLHAVGHLLNTQPTGAAWLSGGNDGPEGSLLVLPTLALAALVIHLTLPRRTYPLTPDQSPLPAPAPDLVHPAPVPFHLDSTSGYEHP